jgi:4-amino-4-deoxy-L-arabinose transferase-like glycosyltransferase
MWRTAIQAPRSLLGSPRLPVLIALVLAGAASLQTLLYAGWRIRSVRGWEADNIARALVGGHGFSFSGDQRWLWDQWNGSETSYYPTAWADPVFTFLLAGAHWVFGEHAFAAIYALDFLCIGLVLYWSWRLAERFAGPWAGAAAIVLLAANTLLGVSVFDTINNTAFAAAAVTLGALVAVRYFERPDSQRLVQLGLYTGFMILTCPVMEFFLPLLAAALLVLHWRDSRARWQRPLALLALALVVVSPWTLRNYLAFGEWVLVRDGGGQLAWDGTVGAASTFAPETTGLQLPPPWKADGPRAAIENLLDVEESYALHRYQVDAVRADPPPGYESSNEAQRDKYYMAASEAFMLREPQIAAELGVAKLEVFAMRFGKYGVIVLALAVAGAVLLRREIRSAPLTLMAAAYCAPFAVLVPYFGRYRTPIEPVLTVLAAVVLLRLVSAYAGGVLGDTTQQRHAANSARMAAPRGG